MEEELRARDWMLGWYLFTECIIWREFVYLKIIWNAGESWDMSVILCYRRPLKNTNNNLINIHDQMNKKTRLTWPFPQHSPHREIPIEFTNQSTATRFWLHIVSKLKEFWISLFKSSEGKRKQTKQRYSTFDGGILWNILTWSDHHCLGQPGEFIVFTCRNKLRCCRLNARLGHLKRIRKKL